MAGKEKKRSYFYLITESILTLFLTVF